MSMLLLASSYVNVTTSSSSALVTPPETDLRADAVSAGLQANAVE
jgi:hypothetical protein